MDRVVIRIYIEAIELERIVELKRELEELLKEVENVSIEVNILPARPR